MCGIAGIVRWRGAGDARASAERMAQAIAHRGPDGRVIFAEGNIALAHCRLAIIDLEHGQQPMTNEAGTIQLVANCEIYNYRALRDELTARGHRFVTASDAEVLVHGYEEWGTGLMDRLRGMFAFAIADFERRRLLLARDHFGIKPLVYHQGPDGLAFASELPALEGALGVPLTGSLEAIDQYLRFRYIPGPQTIYRNVFKLPPASWLMASFDGSVDGPHAYSAVQFGAGIDDGADDASWADRVEETVAASVAAHTIADVPFGVLLSGGVDSTLVSCLARRAVGGPLPAFSIDFADPRYSESEQARAVAKQCGLDLHIECVGPDAMALLPDVVGHQGEPLGDPSALPTWCLARLARQHVPMVLSGDGGDEAFGGYDSYESYLETRAASRFGLAWWRNRGRPTAAGWASQMSVFPHRDRLALWRPELDTAVRTASAAYTDAARGLPARDDLAFAQTMDYRTYLPGDILAKVDAASMAHGLEVRTPLIDREVVALASRLPLRQRWRAEGKSPTVRKFVLRRIVGREFPAAFVQRPKQGFIGPHAEWMLHDAPTREMLRQVITDRSSPLHTLFRTEALDREVEAHRADSDNSGRLWVLLTLGLWMDAHRETRFG